MNDDLEMEIVAETETFSVLRTEDEDGIVYHVELGGVSLHLEPEEWDELVLLIKSAAQS
ncbi:MAG: hypothetical protein KDE51_09940 [Anaerolineales bacterium]|nr:hypothetical protein [Anaerolineales bacterium]